MLEGACICSYAPGGGGSSHLTRPMPGHSTSIMSLQHIAAPRHRSEISSHNLDGGTTGLGDGKNWAGWLRRCCGDTSGQRARRSDEQGDTLLLHYCIPH